MVDSVDFHLQRKQKMVSEDLADEAWHRGFVRALDDWSCE